MGSIVGLVESCHIPGLCSVYKASGKSITYRRKGALDTMSLITMIDQNRTRAEYIDGCDQHA
jgi:hypothetical protein